MIVNRNYNELGSFVNESGTLRVTDPTTPRGHWAAETFKAIPGNWQAATFNKHLRGWGTRSHLIAVKHESVPDFKLFDEVYIHKEHLHYRLGWDVLSRNIFADCAMIGFFDDAHFGVAKPVTGRPVTVETPEDAFEDECAKLTMSKKFGGVIPFGAVSRSGIGDGSYTCLIHINANKQVDAAIVMFL